MRDIFVAIVLVFLFAAVLVAVLVFGYHYGRRSASPPVPQRQGSGVHP